MAKLVQKRFNIIGSLDGLVVDTTNEANPSTSYYYFGLLNEGFNAFSVQHAVVGATITYEGSNDLHTVSNSSATWSDITSMIAGIASFTTNGLLSRNDPLPWSRIRMKRVVTAGVNSVKARLTRILI